MKLKKKKKTWGNTKNYEGLQNTGSSYKICFIYLVINIYIYIKQILLVGKNISFILKIDFLNQNFILKIYQKLWEVIMKEIPKL